MRSTLSISSLVFAVGAALSASALAAPLHYVNVTGTRVVQTVAETTDNEKSIDIGDIDNDGDLDVVVGIALSDFGARKNKLYRNDNGVLTEITSSAIPAFLSARVTRVVFLRDYNNDGWMDIYVVNDSNSNADRLFINQHPGGVFQNFTEMTGLPSGGMLGASCSGVSEDFDGDGNIDVNMGNYPNDSQDRLIMNDGTATFTNVTGSMLPTDQDYAVDTAIDDMNGDGLRDIIVTSGSGDPSYIYYNNNASLGSGPGDFSYPGSKQSMGNHAAENSVEPGDFNGDGMSDIYWGNGAGGTTDQILLNTGNDASGKATFAAAPTSALALSVTNIPSRKATAVDLNNDGRLDVIVMKEDLAGAANERPTILRNTTVNGVLSFVDWTEAVFVNGSTLKGWHSVAFDSNGDGDTDILIGAFNGDHLFEQEPSPTFDAATLVNGIVPGVFDGPATVVTSVGAGASDFIIANVLSGGFLSVIVTGDATADLVLEVLVGGTVVASSDRGGAGVEEALQINNLAPGSVTVRVSIPNPSDITGDGVVDGGDLATLLGVWGLPGGGTAADLNSDGVVDGGDLATLLGNWGSPSTGAFTLELMARN